MVCPCPNPYTSHSEDKDKTRNDRLWQSVGKGTGKEAIKDALMIKPEQCGNGDAVSSDSSGRRAGCEGQVGKSHLDKLSLRPWQHLQVQACSQEVEEVKAE